jgi:hypothetical protein
MLSVVSRTSARLVLLLAMITALLTTTPMTADAAGSATVTGTLTSAGKPVAGAKITSRYADGSHAPSTDTATSAPDGTYSLKIPADVDTQVCATASGLIPACYGDGALVRLAPGATKAGVSFALKSDAVRNLTTPYFVGTPKVGWTLSARPGRWEPAGASLTYAWFDGARQIGTGPTYVVKPAELAHTISVTATASAPGRTPTTVTWTKADHVVAGTFWIGAKPKVVGEALVGRTLRVRPGSSAPAARHTYRWFRNGKAVRGATKRSTESPGAIGASG